MSDSFTKLVFLGQLASTHTMTGVIWFVQVVHYPLFAAAGQETFAAYERRHTALTTWIVGPPMLVEAGTAGLLLWFRPLGVELSQVIAGIALLAVCWLSTALLQVPCHERLSQGFDAIVHRRLVRTNWLRTVAWSLRALLTLWMSWSAFQ